MTLNPNFKVMLNISETVRDRDIYLEWNTNRDLHMHALLKAIISNNFD